MTYEKHQIATHSLFMMPDRDIFLRLIQPVVTNDLIRIGRESDGGYVINRISTLNADLVSFGVNDDWSFEEAYVNISGSSVEMYDGSVSLDIFKSAFRGMFLDFFSLKFLWSCFRIRGHFWRTIGQYRNSKDLYARFANFIGRPDVTFHSFFVSDQSGGRFRSIEEILSRKSQVGSIFLKIDIEGFEYRILKSVASHAAGIRGMVVEFHDVFYESDRFIAAVEGLKESFYITHVHANNYGNESVRHRLPDVWEITFLNKALVSGHPRLTSGRFPIDGLDFPNTPDRADYMYSF